MYTLMVHSTVEDFDHWLQVFESLSSTRRRFGAQGVRVFRSQNDPNEVVVFTEFDTEEHARQWAASPEFRRAVKESGVHGTPEVIPLQELSTVPV